MEQRIKTATKKGTGRSTPTDIEKFRRRAGPKGARRRSSQEDRRARHRISLSAIRVGHRPHHGQGHPGRSLGIDRQEGLPARLRRHHESLPQPARRLSRLRAGGRRAGRHSRARDLHAAPVGQAGGAALVHAVPKSRGARRSRRLPDRRCARQSPPHPRSVQEGPRATASPRHRAGDDVAQEGRERPAEWRLLQSLLLSHRPVREPAGPFICGSSNTAGRWAST